MSNLSASMSTTLIAKFQKVDLTSNENTLKLLFENAVKAVDTRSLVAASVKLKQNTLVVCSQSYELQRPCYIFGFGKAVLGMAVALEEILGDNLHSGILSVPVGIFDTFKEKPALMPKKNSRIRFIEGAKDNLPDTAAMNAAFEIQTTAKELTEQDLVIVLISGGGSALLPLPKGKITLEEKVKFIKELSKCGANINELNSVRKKISSLKGGKLAEELYPAKTICLILSDIVGDPIDSIASGPTFPNTDPQDLALKIIKKYGLLDKTPKSIKNVLLQDIRNSVPIVSDRFKHVDSYIIGSNKIALHGASEIAESIGFSTVVLSDKICGNVVDLARIYADLGRILALMVENRKNRNKLDEFLKKNFEVLNISNETAQKLLDVDENKGE